MRFAHVARMADGMQKGDACISILPGHRSMESIWDILEQPSLSITDREMLNMRQFAKKLQLEAVYMTIFELEHVKSVSNPAVAMLAFSCVFGALKAHCI